MSIEDLLWRGEGETLEFKRDQYKTVRSSDEEKGEFVKDILAMANAWRSEVGTILIGVDETQPPGPSRLVGASNHPDDASLQQLVNGKTNRPVAFSYEIALVSGLQIGVVKVQIQTRPTYLKQSFGKLNAREVYVRRGSSTATADPDEVARMGADRGRDAAPVLALEFADPVSQEGIGTSLTGSSTVLAQPTAGLLSKYRLEPPGSYLSVVVNDSNPQYAEDLWQYTFNRAYRIPVSLLVRNLSAQLASDVRVEFSVAADRIALTADPNQPPSETRLGRISMFVAAPNWREPDITVERRGSLFHVVFKARKVQPKSKVVSPTFCAGVHGDRDEVVKAMIYSDEGEPQEAEIRFELRSHQRPATVQDLDAAVEAAEDEDQA